MGPDPVFGVREKLMNRFLSLALVLTLCFGLFGSSPAGAADNPEWSKIQKEFKDLFKTKLPLKDRRKGVSIVSKSKDGRGVKLLVGALKKQEKHSGKMRKEWQTQEDEWAEKTKRIEEAFEKRRKAHNDRYKKKGEEPPPITIDLNSEEGRWLGGSTHEGEMTREKRRLEKLYRRVLEEEDFVVYMLRGIGRILNCLEGEDFDKHVKLITKAALTAKGDKKPPYVTTLGYVKGDAVTSALERIAEDSDPVIVMKAMESLGRQNTDRGMEILFKYLDDERWQIRASAIQGLAFLKKPEVMDRLILQAQKEEGAVRRRCFGAMAMIVGERVKGTIEAWQSWWKANKDEWMERWKRLPASGPIQDDPPVIPVDAEENSGSTSFYGIKTDSKHIIFVVDVSGSMRADPDAPEGEKSKIDVARTELVNAIKTLSAADEDERGAASFNVVLFSTMVNPYKPGRMVTATKKNKDKVFEWIEEFVIADGMTNIFDALEQAFNMISGSNEKKNMAKGADTIFLMTDGAPNRGKFFEPEMILKEIKRINKERKISIHAIGIGAHHRPFLERLAAENNGKYMAR